MLPLVATLYNPHTQTKQELIDGFVVRLPLFRKLFHEIKTADMHYPEQHFLIEGQRGMGKTTLLLRLAYEIENDTDTNQRLIPIIFEEEVYYRINRLFQLWEETAKLLAKREVAFSGLFEQMDAGYDDHRDYERFSFDLLMTVVQQYGKKLILLIDNFSELCNSFSEQETQRLREILLTCSAIRWIGATTGTLEASFRYQHAFYEFFKKYSLGGLNRTETQELLLQLAKINRQEKVIQTILNQQPGRVESLRILTGGVIRTIVLLFEIFIDRNNGEAIHDLEKILDRVTPLYKHRMEELPAMQREVVTTLAMNWDGMMLSELMRSLRRTAAEIETTLAELKEFNLIELKVVDTQTQWYFLQERFFNIWYLMRLAVGAKPRVIWLVRFLEAWCDKEQLIERAKSHIGALANKPEYPPKAAYYYAEALAQTGKLDWELEDELTSKTREFLKLHDANLARELSPSDYELFEQIVNFFDKEEYEQAKRLLLQIKQSNEAVYLSLAICYRLLENFAEAEHCLLMAVEKRDEIDMVSYGLLGELYHDDFKDYTKAEHYYLMAIGKGNIDAIFKLAFLYQKEFKNYSKAKHYYLMAIEQGNERAMFNLALLYETKFKNYSKAKHYYLMAIEQGNEQAMFYLAILYHAKFKDYHKAEYYYLMAVDKGVVNAIRNLALLYQNEFKDYPKAEHYYLMAIEKGNEQVMKQVALDCLQKKIHKYTALCCVEQAIKKDPTDYLAYLLACIIYVWHHRFAEAVEMAKSFIDKEDYYKRYKEDYYKRYLEEGVNIYLLFLLAKQQYAIVHNYFENPQLTLKDRFKPIYYAFLKLTNDTEFGRMPPELDETVTQILAEIQTIATDYA